MARIAYFRLTARDRDELHRGSTSLELMFDLATVVAVAAAAHGLTEDIDRDRFALGAVKFASSFFMAWLAWMNYTWLASGYDNRSAAFRFLSLVIIFGSFTLAGGIHNDDGGQPIWLELVGFTIMRLGLIALWLGVANGDRNERPTALRYAAAIAVMQLYWHVLIFAVLPQAASYLPLFLLGAVGELAIPAFAERNRPSNWHHGHIIDRYNLFNIIVLGECFVAISMIVADSGAPDFKHFLLAGLCFIIAFSMWGLYFDRNKQLIGREPIVVFTWAYGHYFLFAGGAATAAGFSAFFAAGNGAAIESEAALSISVPVAVYLTALWLVRDRLSGQGARHWFLLVTAAFVLISSMFASYVLELIAAILVVTVTVRGKLYHASA